MRFGVEGARMRSRLLWRVCGAVWVLGRHSGGLVLGRRVGVGGRGRRGRGVRAQRVVVRPWLWMLCAMERGGVRDVDYWFRINVC